MFQRILLSALFAIGVTAGALFALLVGEANADEVDEVLNYLVQERLDERLSGGALAAAESGNTEFFRNTNQYRIDKVRRSEENGAVELSATYYSVAKGPTFTVRLLRPIVAQKSTRFVSQVNTIARLYREAAARNEFEVRGFKSAFIDAESAQDKSDQSKGVIVRLAENVYLIVQANEFLPTASIATFLDNVPLDDYQSALGI